MFSTIAFKRWYPITFFFLIFLFELQKDLQGSLGEAQGSFLNQLISEYNNN